MIAIFKYNEKKLQSSILSNLNIDNKLKTDRGLSGNKM